MKKHLVVVVFICLSAVANLMSCLLTPQLAHRNGVFAAVSIGMLALLFALREYLPPSRIWTRASAPQFGLYCAGLELFSLFVDHFAETAPNFGSSTGTALFLSTLLLFNLVGKQPQAPLC
jgi:hypothetical protein